MWAPISQPPKSAAAKVKYVVGMVVEHSKWGQGRVIETSVLGDQPVILVEFSGGDRRRLMADFAPLTVVEG
jgi:hypothetical protein